MAKIVDVVSAVKRGDSIQVTIPARLVKRLGIRKGDRLAVYLTYDEDLDTEAILYVPIRETQGADRARSQGQAQRVLATNGGQRGRVPEFFWEVRP